MRILRVSSLTTENLNLVKNEDVIGGGAGSLVGYDVALTRRRSQVQVLPGPPP